MSERYWPYDSESADRVHGSLHVARALQSLIDDGVAFDQADELEVVATSPESMTVEVSLGTAWVQGRYYELYSAPEEVAVPAADSTNPRLDRVVVRRSLANRETTVELLTGTPEPSPSMPALTEDPEGDWEIPLAAILVPATATEIEAGDITDQRSLVFPVATDRPVAAARVSKSADQVIPTGVLTLVSWNTEDFDTDGIHDLVVNNSRLQCKTAGIYTITAELHWAANTGGRRFALLRVNGAGEIGRSEVPPAGNQPTRHTATCLWQLALDDYVDVQVLQNSPGNLNLLSSSHFEMARIG